MSTQERQQRFSGTKDVAPSLRFDDAKLCAYLLQHVEGFAPPLSVRQFRGGQSNPTYELASRDRKFVLRRKPPGPLLPSAHAIDREYRIIAALYPTGFPVAKPYVLCEDESVIGTSFYVMDHVEGRIFWGPFLPDLSPEERSAIYDSMNATIARLHTLDYEKLGLSEFGRPGNYIARQIARWTKQFRASETERIDAMDRLIDWLPEHLPLQERNAIVHGDFRLDNLILDPERPEILAVLDWELSTIGDPLADFTYHLMQWQMPPGIATNGAGSLMDVDRKALGIPEMADYVSSYCRRTGRAAVPNLDYYAAYNFFRLAAILQGIVGRVRDGTAASENAAQNAASVRPLAERGWYYAERAGATSG
jgi:aminoglycoside phosphotransferase (APT) family kinase protein